MALFTVNPCETLEPPETLNSFIVLCCAECMSALCSCCNKRPFTGTERQCLCHHSAVALQAQTLAARTKSALLDGSRR
ncbi:unnamed protein product [Arctogadus glacialis]